MGFFLPKIVTKGRFMIENLELKKCDAEEISIFKDSEKNEDSFIVYFRDRGNWIVAVELWSSSLQEWVITPFEFIPEGSQKDIQEKLLEKINEPIEREWKPWEPDDAA